jgi:hypothetical protein
MKGENMIVEFEGIPSSQYESFCWDVDENTYRRLMQMRFDKEPHFTPTGLEINKDINTFMEFDKSEYNDGLYSISPLDLGLDSIWEKGRGKKYKIRIEYEIID